MARKIRQLVSRNLLDSLFLAIPEEKRAEAAELCLGRSYDRAHPHAFYSLIVAREVVQALGELLDPTATLEWQQYLVGWALAEGYRSTVAGWWWPGGGQ